MKKLFIISLLSAVMLNSFACAITCEDAKKAAKELISSKLAFETSNDKAEKKKQRDIFSAACDKLTSIKTLNCEGEEMKGDDFKGCKDEVKKMDEALK
jgi:hypothetical protein